MAEDTRNEWMGELHAIRESCGQARAHVSSIEEWVWNDIVGHCVLPRELPEELRRFLARLREALEHVEQQCIAALDRYSVRPASLIARGYPLSEQEFHIASAMQLVQVGLPDHPSDFEVFTMMCYEDDARVAYINPAERPKKGPLVWLRFGISPEEVDAHSLRPEQREFFQKWLPETYARFRNSSSPLL